MADVQRSARRATAVRAAPTPLGSLRPCNRLGLGWVAAISALLAITAGRLIAGQVASIDEASLLPVVYFYSPTCLECRKAGVSLDAAQVKYAGRIRLERHSIATAEGLELMFAYEEKYGAPEGSPPRVFVGTRYLDDAGAIIAGLDPLIRKELEARKSQPTITIAATSPATMSAILRQPVDVVDDGSLASEARPDLTPAAVRPESGGIDGPHAVADATTPTSPTPADAGPGTRLVRRFQSFQVSAIMLAGLIDGVNPCAFTTIVFLLSAMAYLGKTKRQIAVVGVTFTSAVFATYMLLGLGLMLTVKAFAVQTGVTQAITYSIAGLTFILAGWSLFDGIRISRSGELPKNTLGLPKFVKGVIHRVIRTGLKTPNLIMGALAVGFLVSLLESLCTGQVYLPTIMIMLRSPGHGLSALSYLLIYNVMFIMPLAIIMLSAYFGVKSERLGQFLRRHLAALKFALAGLFAGLGLMLLFL